MLAHDYGDTVAQELLARHASAARAASRARLASVCFLNGGLFPESHRAAAGPEAAAPARSGRLIARLVDRARFARSFAEVFGPRTQPSAAELRRLLDAARARTTATRVAPRADRATCDERREHRERWVGALQRQRRCRCASSTAPDDPVSGAHMAERYRELVPNPDVVLLDGIGHYPQLEAPDQVLAAFLEFVLAKAES